MPVPEAALSVPLHGSWSTNEEASICAPYAPHGCRPGINIYDIPGASILPIIGNYTNEMTTGGYLNLFLRQCKERFSEY
jgi:hypothetical protein